MDIIDEKSVPWIEVKKALEAKEKDKELGYEQKNALEHLRKFCKLGPKQAQELAEKLSGIGKLKERQVAAILNFLPQTPDDLRLLFAYDPLNASEDEKKSMVNAVKSALE